MYWDRNEKFIMRWGEVSQSVVTSIAYIVLGVAFIASLYVIKYVNAKKELTTVSVESKEEKEPELVEVKEEVPSKTKKTTRKSSIKKEDK